MFLGAMRHEPVTIPWKPSVDWKGVGYLFSIAGALLLGAEAWPKPMDPWWHWPTLLGGVLTTITGFAVRYVAHLRQRREIEEAKHDAKIAKKQKR